MHLDTDLLSHVMALCFLAAVGKSVYPVSHLCKDHTMRYLLAIQYIPQISWMDLGSQFFMFYGHDLSHESDPLSSAISSGVNSMNVDLWNTCSFCGMMLAVMAGPASIMSLR